MENRKPINVESLGDRHFRLSPYPLDVSPLVVEFPARHVDGKIFGDVNEFQAKFNAAQVEALSVTISA